MGILDIVFFIVILLFSVILHEIAHGYVALSLGDPTAKNAGRLTLNPIPHIDPVGSIAVPLVMLFTTSALPGGPRAFGWAKPVPVNPFNLRDQKYGSSKVSIAGPLANLGIAIVFGLLLRFFTAPIAESFPSLLPLFFGIVQLNLVLALFNLMPIPPLDGSHILFDFLPKSLYGVQKFLTQYGVFVLLFFVFFLFRFLDAPLQWLFRLIVGF